MKQIKFDARFKEAILNKTMIATIRNDDILNEKDIFEIVTDEKVIAKARCVQRDLGFQGRFFLNLIYNGDTRNCVYFYGRRNNDLYTFNFEELGFSNIENLNSYYYEKLNKKDKTSYYEHCYLHIFELIGD